MRHQNNIPNESPEIWDDGTYQTGATPNGKRQSALITGLLITTIFFGGIASALGIMNVRLLQQLSQQDPVLPVTVDSKEGELKGFLWGNQQSTPKVPQNSHVELNTAPSAGILSEEALQAQVEHSVVEVTVMDHQGVERTGHALIIHEDGYLLTNAHLTGNASAITVGMPDGQLLQAAIVGRDDYADLAVLYVQSHNLTSAVFSKADWTAAVGYVPHGQQSIEKGDQLSDVRQIEVGKDTISLYKTDFSVDHGPVFDEGGLVRGFLCRPFGGEEGGWMLSNDQVLDIAAQLVEKGSVSGRPCLGLQVKDLSTFYRQYWKLESGLEISGIQPDSAPQEQGLLAGDILLKLNGREMTHRFRLFEMLLAVPAGENVTLEIFRAGQTFTVTLPVTETP